MCVLRACLVQFALQCNVNLVLGTNVTVAFFFFYHSVPVISSFGAVALPVILVMMSKIADAHEQGEVLMLTLD